MVGIVFPLMVTPALSIQGKRSTGVCDLPSAESRMILDLLFEHIKNPAFQVRMHWRKGDIAFWDNRARRHLPA